MLSSSKDFFKTPAAERTGRFYDAAASQYGFLLPFFPRDRLTTNRVTRALESYPWAVNRLPRKHRTHARLVRAIHSDIRGVRHMKPADFDDRICCAILERDPAFMVYAPLERFSAARLRRYARLYPSFSRVAAMATDVEYSPKSGRSVEPSLWRV